MVPLPIPNNYFFLQRNHPNKQQVNKQVSNNLSQTNNNNIRQRSFQSDTRLLDQHKYYHLPTIVPVIHLR